MDQNERQIIDDLFARLRQAEGQGVRDAEAEALIARHVASQAAAPYYMAQAIVVQQDALGKAQARLQALERQLTERPSGGFLSGLFGGGQEAPATPGGARPFRSGNPQAGTGFLGGAMQTALGVAGGFLIADALTGLLSADDAAAAAPGAGPSDHAASEDDEPLLGDDASMGDDGDIDMSGFDDF